MTLLLLAESLISFNDEKVGMLPVCTLIPYSGFIYAVLSPEDKGYSVRQHLKLASNCNTIADAHTFSRDRVPAQIIGRRKESGAILCEVPAAYPFLFLNLFF